MSRSETASAETERYTVDCTVEVVPSQEALAPFVSLRHRTDSVPVLLPDDGVVLTEKLASLLGVSAGDTFTLDGTAGSRYGWRMSRSTISCTMST